MEEVGQRAVEIRALPLAAAHDEVAQSQGRRLQHLPHPLGRLLQHLRRHGQAAMLPARREVRLQPLGVVDHLPLQGRRIDREHQRLAQHLGERDGRAGEQRQVVLPAGELAARPQGLQQLGRLRPPVRIGRLAAGEEVRQLPRLVRAGGEEREGKDADGVQRVLGALRLGVEPADRLHGIAEEVEPDGGLLPRREEVEDAAAHGEVPHLVDQIGAPEAVAGEVGDHLLDGVILVRTDGEHRAEEVLAAGQLAEEGARGRHHGRQPAGGDAVERHRLLGAHHQGGLGLLVGGQRGRGEVDDPLLAAEEARRLHPGQGVGLARHQHQDRPAEIAGEQLPDPRRRGQRQAHHVPEPLRRGTCKAHCCVGSVTDPPKPGRPCRESNVEREPEIPGCGNLQAEP